MFTKSTFMVAGLALALGTTAAHAQVQVASTAPPEDRAAALRLQAEAFIGTEGQWRRATPLLERSAAASPAEDPHAFDSLRLAGRLRALDGQYDAARRNFERAGDRALALGFVVDAANAYLDGATAALKTGDRRTARTLVDRASLLSASPLLTATQAQSIRSRIKA